MSQAFAKRLAKLSDKQWASVLKGLDATSKKKLEQAVNKVDKSKPPKKASSVNKPRSSQKDNPLFATDQSRRGKYRFGKGTIPFYRPTEGYPSEEEASAPVGGSLTMQHAYGFTGTSRQNLLLCEGRLVYFLAAVGVVHNLGDGTQQFFTDHNDDITTICKDPREGSMMVATGQKDPKDTQGQGKDLPKIYVWNCETMETVCLIDKVCPQTILRVQWSKVSGYLYVICGDKNQTLKVYDVSGLNGKKADKKAIEKANTPLLDTPSTSDKILGFAIRDTPCEESIDELVFYCSNKILTATITKPGSKLVMKKPQAVKVKGKEKAFVSCQFLADGSFLAGATSGNIYSCKGKDVLKVHKSVHKKGVTAMVLDGNILTTSSMDQTVKRFEVSESGDELKESSASDVIKIENSDFVMRPVAIAVDGNTLYAGTKSNQIISFDIESQDTNLLIDGHDGQIHALGCHPTEDVFVTGGWDRAVKVWDPSTFTCTKTYEFPKMGQEDEKEMHKDSWQMTVACWSPDGRWIVVGTEMSGLAVLSYDPFVLCSTHQIPLANKNQKELEGISYLRFSPCGKYLAVAHMDAHLYIFNVSVNKNGDSMKLKPWKKGMKHRAAPSNLQWSEDSKFVKCLTRDYEVAHWQLNLKAKKGTHCVKIPDPDKLKWNGDPLIAGWDVQGLYQPDWDGTDLNDACLTSDGKLIFSGDDYGTVRIHNYPAIDPKQHISYHGHAEFVQGVELLPSDTSLITCGGADMAIFQWTINRE